MDQMPNNNQRLTFISPSMILGGLAAILILIGTLIPMMDFSTFHEKIHIKYNIFKICKNVGMISPTWKGIPYGFILVLIAFTILAFVDLPILKLIPSLIGIALLVIMYVDGINVLNWARDTVDMYFGKEDIQLEMAQVYKSLRAGIYLIATGVLVGLVSCFVPGRKYE